MLAAKSLSWRMFELEAGRILMWDPRHMRSTSHQKLEIKVTKTTIGVFIKRYTTEYQEYGKRMNNQG
jgi:hypothetical protein